ncbi:Gfo/Idh/MocA family protein [Parapedobacter defluvii]|uniref:Gfo/Idh/MocA family protein n=1 Tax=Parapedobacter defluvii TaxID=2045106 RepID=UPI000F99B35D|nr:Gfo/Idh/MocA family oxidoreductase [Parapedobacter defluvii]RQP10245.1 MAG: gfo/Idh/MocA family oxidoreductase [Parapedobacter sp.]
MIVPTHRFSILFFISVLLFFSSAFAKEPLKVAVAGLSHDHVHTLLRAYQQHEVAILGIAETDTALANRYRNRYGLPDSLFFRTVTEMMQAIRPDAVLAYNAISEHVDVAEVCLPLKVPLMVEKPLAVDNKQARRIAQLAAEHHTPVFTNYETTWYDSNQTLRQLVAAGNIGALKKVMVKDGHQGPREIGCSEDFLSWLTDPEKNGGGALIDFGCYGANLMTWLMNGERPIAVTAVTRQLKPSIYPLVDDDATIILEYKSGTTGIIQASWDWPYSIKDLQVYGESTSLHAVDPGTLLRYTGPRKQEQIPLQTEYFDDQLSYLKALLDGEADGTDDLSSLSNNLIVVEILQAARESAKRGERILMDGR